MSGEQTSARLDELDALRAAATPGPWFAWDRGVGWNIATEDPTGVDHLPGRPYLLPEGLRTDLARGEDAALIVAAVNALGPLVAAVRLLLRDADELDRWARENEQSSDAFDRGCADAERAAAHRIRSTIAAALAAGRPDEEGDGRG